MARTALRIVVAGLVQGVGFRPAVYRAARDSGVKGFVRNVGGSEVEIWVEGSDEDISRFFTCFARWLPPPARIEEIIVERVKPRGFNRFSILRSESRIFKPSAIPPDLAMCEHCLREVLDPSDRRFRYPFNSCAWCGPRYSMMRSVPYDRENTSMNDFPLCEQCLSEYRDPNNVRRFHAQGISCPRCGPRLWLETVDGERIECRDPLREAARLIEEGFIVAVKGLGGYHVACLASDDDVVRKLRERKRRPTKPFAVMALDTDVASRLVEMSDRAKAILQSAERPILLLPKRSGSPVAPSVSPGMDVEGVFLPYTPLHYLLLQETRDRFLVMTSGNVHGEPMCRDSECVRERLRDVVDYVLNHDREIVHRVDDSVARFTRGRLVLLRLGRGYAPTWIKLPAELPKPVIALGAQLQTNAGVGIGDRAALTPYIGDLDSAEALEDLEQEVSFLARSYRVDLSRSVIAIDMHPSYSSRSLAEELSSRHGCEVVEVQHHLAHVISTAVDRGLGLEVLGIAMDGVGYGADGTVWGGEVIEVRWGSWRRVGSLEPIPQTSDRDAIYPSRIAAACLLKAFGASRALEIARSLGLEKGLPMGWLEIEAVARSVEAGRYVPSSSTGRVVDAVSAMLGVCRYRSYEGEPAILLEAVARRGRELEWFPRPRIVAGDVPRVSTSDLIKSVVSAIEAGERAEDIARTFLLRLGEGLGEIAARYASRYRTVVLGGGAAVNDYIVEGIERVLRARGIEVCLPRRVPPNDGGVALGQIGYVAAKLLATG